MIVGNGVEPADLDPQTNTGLAEGHILDTLFEGLVRTNPETLEPEPGVASHWEVSEGGLVYTFHLRPDAAWSDGHPVTAYDFYDSYQRMLSPWSHSANAEQFYIVAGAEAYHTRVLRDFADVGFRVLDNYTLEVRLHRTMDIFPRLMASRAWYPVPMHRLRSLGDPFVPGNPWTRHRSTYVGNGPFKMKTWRRGRLFEVERNPYYWGHDTVRLNGVRFLPLSGKQEEDAFLAGKLHKTIGVEPGRMEYYQNQNTQWLRLSPSSGIYFYVFNVQRPPFNDVRVRQALAMAVDRERLVNEVTRSGEKPAYHLTLEREGSAYRSRVRTRLDYAAARALLAEAGYPGGAGLPPISVLINSTSVKHRDLANEIAADWQRELGVQIELESQDWPVFLERLNLRLFQIARGGIIVEPYTALRFLRNFTADSAFNNTGWHNEEFDRLSEEIDTLNDREARLERMHRMEAILMEEMPTIPLYYYTNQYLLHPSVKGWADNISRRMPFERAWLENP